MSEFKKWFSARARNPDKITLEEAFCAGASAQSRVQPAPSVQDGWKLVPTEPTPMMKTAGIGVEVYQDSPPSSDCLTWEEVEAIYTAMLAAAPEAKSFRRAGKNRFRREEE